MDLVFTINLSLLLIAWGAQIFLRSFLRLHRKLIFGVFLVIAFLGPIIQSHKLFVFWVNSAPPTRYLLPPFNSIRYFFLISGRMYWLSYVIALIIALLVMLAIFLIKKERRDLIFEKDEPYLIALPFLILGHPIWIIYLFLVLVAYLLYSLIRSLSVKNKQRVSFYYFWLPIAILALVLTPWIVRFLPFIQSLRLHA